LVLRLEVKELPWLNSWNPSLDVINKFLAFIISLFKSIQPLREDIFVSIIRGITVDVEVVCGVIEES
jgi:hypothetical protein